jgi:hypothetical protein
VKKMKKLVLIDEFKATDTIGHVQEVIESELAQFPKIVLSVVKLKIYRNKDKAVVGIVKINLLTE